MQGWISISAAKIDDDCFTGFCHQLNSEGDLIADHAGLSGGVWFVLNVMSDEYFVGPWSYCEGFWVSIIHDVHSNLNNRITQMLLVSVCIKDYLFSDMRLQDAMLSTLSWKRQHVFCYLYASMWFFIIHVGINHWSQFSSSCDWNELWSSIWLWDWYGYY